VILSGCVPHPAAAGGAPGHVTEVPRCACDVAGCMGRMHEALQAFRCDGEGDFGAKHNLTPHTYTAKYLTV